ncbi:MAG: efflux RND transporter periplasmic adaptor subunit [Bacteroidales bacterium]
MKNIIETIKANYQLILAVLLTGIATGIIAGNIFSSKTAEKTPSQQAQNHEAEKSETWTCSMHPQIKQDKPGDCPICGMELIPVTSLDEQGDDIDPNEIMMSESAAKLADIQTTTVRKGSPEKTIFMQGKVTADERNITALTARFGGRIEKLYINFTGKHVKKGEKLASIYSPDMITARRELLEALEVKETRPEMYKAAKSKLKLWDLTDKQIEDIEKQKDPEPYFDLLSPHSGTVMKRNVAQGNYVKMGDPLFKITDLSKVWIMFDAYEADLPWIKTGDQINISVEAMPGKTYTANVNYIDPFITTDTRTTKIRVELKNPGLTLKPGMFASGKLHSQIAMETEKMLIPKSAVLWTGKRSLVFVKVPNRSSPSFLSREIELGPSAGKFFVVADGLTQGEEIATNGVFKIDAAAQMEGKRSMMNPKGEATHTGHAHADKNMNEMNMDDDAKAHEKKTQQNENETSFSVSGKCGMCKTRIEKAALNLEGVNFALWEEDSRKLTIKYDDAKLTLEDVHQAIAEAGHDTKKVKADDQTYESLPACCKYRD